MAEVDEASGTEEQMIEALAGARVCLTQLAPLTARILDACPDLELFAVSRGGPVNANLEAATEHGVAVTFAPGRNAAATAEYAVGLMLAAMRGIPHSHAGVLAGRWESDLLRLRRHRPGAGGHHGRARRRRGDRLPGGAHPAGVRRRRGRVRPLRRARLPCPGVRFVELDELLAVGAGACRCTPGSPTRTAA